MFNPFSFVAQGVNQIATWMHEEEMQDDSQAFAQEQQQRGNWFSAEQAKLQRDWSERMRGSQWQTAVEDMRKAGLNPALAYQQGGAGVPPGAAASSSGAPAPSGPGTNKFDMSAALLNSAQLGKIEAEQKNIEADTKLKLEGQLPELVQRALTGKASAAELDARRQVLEQEFKVLEEKLKWLPMLQRLNVESLSYDVQEKLRAFQQDYPNIQKQVLEAKLLGMKIPEGLAEAAFWSREGQSASYFRHAPKSIIPMITGAGGSVSRDVVDFFDELIRKFNAK